MDNVLVDFPSAFPRVDSELFIKYPEKDEIPGIFSLMDPVPGAVEAYEKLSKKYDTYILSTAPWKIETAWSDKLLWVKKLLGDGENIHKRLILSHHKNLCLGDYLIDDRTANGVSNFKGEHIHFGTEKFPNWEAVTKYLIK